MVPMVVTLCREKTVSGGVKEKFFFYPFSRSNWLLIETFWRTSVLPDLPEYEAKGN